MYDLVVLDPIRLAADQFVEDSVRLITDRVQLIQAFTDEKDVAQMVRQLIGEFNEGYLTFKSRVSRADGSWPFDDLSDVDDQVLALQDKITPLLATLPNAAVDFADELDEAVADVIAVVLQHAPVLKKGRVKRLLSWAGQKLSISGSDDRKRRKRIGSG